MLIHPSLPSPTGFLQSWWRPRFYGKAPSVSADKSKVFVVRFNRGPDISALEDLFVPGNKITTWVCMFPDAFSLYALDY